MKFNWKVRFKNPFFWFSMISVILTSINVRPEMLTSWSILISEIEALFKNPFLLGTTIIAVFGVIYDPTTKGICDSKQALEYDELG